MRCHICNTSIESIEYEDDGITIKPCPKCQEEVRTAILEKELEELMEEDTENT